MRNAAISRRHDAKKSPELLGVFLEFDLLEPERWANLE
jgi:hypothetical protein